MTILGFSLPVSAFHLGALYGHLERPAFTVGLLHPASITITTTRNVNDLLVGACAPRIREMIGVQVRSGFSSKMSVVFPEHVAGVYI